MMRWTSPETGDAIVDIVTSIAQYAENIYKMNLLTANYSGKKATLKTLDEINAKIDFAEKEVNTLPGHPGDYLRAMLKSHRTLVRWLAKDKSLTYHAAVKDILEVDLKEIPKENFLRTAERIDKTLTDWGYKGTADDKIKLWQDDMRIPADQVINVAHKYIDRCREKTMRTVIKDYPKDKIDSINGITGVYFSGLSEYLGDYTGRLTFNIERPWNSATFAAVLAHEAYPGHHVYYTLWDYMFRKGELPLEAAYVLINSPINCLFEGVPDIGIRILGWDDPTQDTPEISDKEKSEIILAKEIGDLQRMYQTNGSYFYNVEGQTKEQVIAYMRSNGWYSEIEANNCFKYFSHEYKCIYYPCYYYGRWIMQKSYDLFPRDRLPEYYDIIYKKPQTNLTLIKDIEAATGKAFNPFVGI